MPIKSITPVTAFPKGTFLENLAVRKDTSILITVHLSNALYLVPAGPSPRPVLLHTFAHNTLGIVESQPDIFHISTSTPDEPNSSSLWRLDMNGWTPGSELALSKTLDIPGAKWLNGSALLSEEKQVLLLADSFAGCIWRVDLLPAPRVSVWVKDESMLPDPESVYKEGPGVNGVKVSREGYVYFSNTMKALFGRVRVDQESFGPQGGVEVLVEGIAGGDDFVVDEDRGGVFLTMHPGSGLEFVSFGGKRASLVAEQSEELMVGPTAVAWGRGDGEEGKVLFVTTEGGMIVPFDEQGLREALLLRIELE